MLYRSFSFTYVARHLKHARIRRKITQAQLAKASGVRQATISKLEKQTGNDVNLATLEKLAAALHANMEVKITLADIEPTQKPVPTGNQLKELNMYEIERLNRLPTQGGPTEAPPNKWAGRYTTTTYINPDTGARTDEIVLDDPNDEELMQACMNGELG